MLAFLLLFIIAAGYYMYRFAIVRDHSGKRQVNFWENEIHGSKNFTDAENSMIKEGSAYIKSHVTELVKIKSHDGLTLVGHIIEHPNPRGVFLMVHGYRSHAAYDFSCAAKAVHDMGFSCLLIDQRCHGYSDGERIGFGSLERYDVVRWAAFAEERWGLPVVLDGVSMGAATVMMGGEIGYPKSVVAIIADCGYTTAGQICRKTLKDWFKLPPFPIYYAAKFFVRVLAKYDLDGADSRVGLAEIKKRGIPILIAHGKSDTFVPYSMSLENMKIFDGDERHTAELFTSDSADHAQAFLRDRETYLEAINRLFKKAGI